MWAYFNIFWITIILLTLWKLNEKKYPLLFPVALDILPVQASTVPCKHIFSSSKQSREDHQNRATPKLFEALQFWKHALKKNHLDFTKHYSVAKEEDYTIEGQVTDKAAWKLISQGWVDILSELLNNSLDPL